MTAPDVDICEVLERESMGHVELEFLARAAAELRQTRKELKSAKASVAKWEADEIHKASCCANNESDLAAAVKLLTKAAHGDRWLEDVVAFLDALAKRGQ